MILKFVAHQDFDAPAHFEALAADTRALLTTWIAAAPDTVLCSGRTSYRLKHDFEDATGIYVTNGQFKGAMLAAGYTASNPDERNWTFNPAGIPF